MSCFRVCFSLVCLGFLIFFFPSAYYVFQYFPKFSSCRVLAVKLALALLLLKSELILPSSRLPE